MKDTTMEKFSTWRPSHTGPFHRTGPVRLSTPAAFRLPITQPTLDPLAAFGPLQDTLSALPGRFLCLPRRLGSSLVSHHKTPQIFSVRFHATFQYYCTTIFARIALHLLGFTTLPSDPPFSHRTSSQKLISTPVQPGDVVVCNWSSYVDVIYLAYLYNPIFILPVFLKDGDGAEQGATDPVVHAFERKSLVQIVARTGHPPTTTTTIITSTTKNIKSLAQFLHDSRRLQRPLVVFPEACTQPP
ncbi:hypothetical protein VP01_44g2 [Puccinia sorghi]|uniref:Phospholipid/glycerol acyltransferase domain-containing protein n=1 Tax=Puccinia sorghi TaxID=27349 RepID=A0A0L6UP45_9BASI|nr:hypothetical protein VP01_44g2 [Puccinia sorghi]